MTITLKTSQVPLPNHIPLLPISASPWGFPTTPFQETWASRSCTRSCVTRGWDRHGWGRIPREEAPNRVLDSVQLPWEFAGAPSRAVSMSPGERGLSVPAAPGGTLVRTRFRSSHGRAAGTWLSVFPHLRSSAASNSDGPKQRALGASHSVLTTDLGEQVWISLPWALFILFYDCLVFSKQKTALFADLCSFILKLIREHWKHIQK